MSTAPPVALVVDDDVDVRSCLTAILEARYAVIPAGSGLEALAQLARRPVDVMLLDVRMPEMDGLEVLRRVRATSSELPVVLLTGVESVRTAADAMKLGARDYLLKPIRDVALFGALDEALGLLAGDVIVGHTGSDLGRRVALPALLGAIAGIRCVPESAGGGARAGDHVVVVDGRPGFAITCAQIRRLRPRLGPRLPRPGSMVERLVELLGASYGTATVGSLADGLRCTTRHLTRVIGGETGMTPQRWIARIRVEVAKCLLLETSRAVDVIGDEAGFCDASHFARAFRAYTGTSPGAYRRTNGMSEISQSMSGPFIA